MWWISILGVIFLVAISFIICSLHYQKHFSEKNEMNLYFTSQVLQMHNALYGKKVDIVNEFSNISFNILLKGIITIICILMIHFTDSLFITSIYIFYLLLTFWVYWNRKEHFKRLDSASKDLLGPVFKITYILPWFHLAFYILLFVTYLLND